MVTISAFADEISPDLIEQLDVLESEGIRHIEFRGVWNKNVLDLSDDELQTVRNQLRARGFRVSAVGSPIGKISIEDDFDEHLRRFERAIAVAKAFDTSYIRIFSFFIPDGAAADGYRDEVLRRIGELVRRAEAAGVILLHENEKDIYGDTPKRCLDLFSSCPSPALQAAFDPANFVQCGVKPFQEAFPLLRPHVTYVHIKDALFDGKRVVPVGEGDGEVRDVLRTLFEGGYSGFLSIEPHLAHASAFQGFSGPDLFRVAARALKSMLAELGKEWR
ncbi:sugar phosphate isomerase/epimerase family protein [Alicyclobacillus acidiphilus]|jgi:sugar phosphate isomerase/epimerase|uniref:sugar phosphate isomerase/epimerase family protein n=1 Tax=Alicyclobacillus acidiphilus TaxID=182455 RepID=UPI00082B171E|nr:sugar phosphate isomerase/epimerase family protein [Alicyclobacillus acidiphilus]